MEYATMPHILCVEKRHMQLQPVTTCDTNNLSVPSLGCDVVVSAHNVGYTIV